MYYNQYMTPTSYYQQAVDYNYANYGQGWYPSSTYNQYQPNYETSNAYYKPSFPEYVFKKVKNAYNHLVSHHQVAESFDYPEASPTQYYQPQYQATYNMKPQEIAYQVNKDRGCAADVPNCKGVKNPKKTLHQSRSNANNKHTNFIPVSRSKKDIAVAKKQTTNKSKSRNDLVERVRKPSPAKRLVVADSKVVEEELPQLDLLITSSNHSSKTTGQFSNKAGLTATEDVDKLLSEMGYTLPPLEPELINGYEPATPKIKQDLMFSYGLTEHEFDKAEQLFTKYCKNGKFELRNLSKVFPNNPLADRIQIPELTNDDGDFLKFEEYLNIYQILKDLELE